MSGSAPNQPFERGIGVRAREAGGAGHGIPRGRTEGEQRAIHPALGRCEGERREIEFSSNGDYYYLNPGRESSPRWILAARSGRGESPSGGRSVPGGT